MGQQAAAVASGFGCPVAVASESSRLEADSAGALRAEGPGGFPSRSSSQGS